MKLLIQIVLGLLALACLMTYLGCDDCGCKDQSQKTRIVTPPVKSTEWVNGQPEVLLDGYIRQADWNRMVITYESAYGYIKVIGPICGNGMPVWSGMHIYELNFHHYVDPDEHTVTATNCYVIDYVLHAPTGDYKP